MNSKSLTAMVNTCVISVLCLLSCAHLAKAQELIFESARIGPTNQFGYGLSINLSQYFGVRFHLEQDTLITGVGGHLLNHGFLSSDSFDATLVRLANHSAFPAGSPFTADEIVTAAPCTLISNFSRDYIFPMTAVLPAGHYALVFGGGTVNAAMPGNDEEARHASYIVWDVDGWRDYPQTGNGRRALPDYRFTLYGVSLE